MSFSEFSLQSFDVQQAIDPEPLMVTPETSLADVLILMTESQRCCQVPLHPALDTYPEEVISSYVLITTPVIHLNGHFPETLSQESIIGILTEQEIMKLIAFANIPPGNWEILKQIPVREVMSKSVSFLEEIPEHDIFILLSLFRQHRSNYLIIITRENRFLGVIVKDKVRPLLPPVNILKLRRVTELMNPPIAVSVQNNLFQISKLMYQHQVNTLVLSQENPVFRGKGSQKFYPSGSLFPCGVITSQDLLSCLFLGVNFERVSVEDVMMKNFYSLKASDSLWVAYRQMQQYKIYQFVICSPRGEFLGIFNQNHLLQVLSPGEMYRTVKHLQQSVHQLQTEKFQLLQNRNEELEKEVQERTAKINEQWHNDRLLAKIALEIHRSLDLEEILNLAVQEVHQLLQVERVFIVQLQSEQCSVTVAESVSPGWSSLLGKQFPQELFPKPSVNFLPDAYIISNIKAANFTPIELSHWQKMETKALVFVPILQDHYLWGMFGVNQCFYEREWQESEVNLISQLATQLAIAIQKAQLYKQVQNLNTDLEKQVQERTLELEKKVLELEELNCLKDEFLSIVSHELRTPLTNMKMAIKMLELLKNSERFENYLDILKNECNREIELINDLLDLQRLDAEVYHITLENVNLMDVLPSTVEPFYTRANNNQQILRIDWEENLPILLSNLAILRRILAELLNNACKYTAQGGQIFLQVKLISQPQQICQFIIKNEANISPDQLPKIFDKFYRIPNMDPWKQGGTGLGLTLVKKRVIQLGGIIEVESEDGWTTFTLSFPYN